MHGSEKLKGSSDGQNCIIRTSSTLGGLLAVVRDGEKWRIDSEVVDVVGHDSAKLSHCDSANHFDWI